MNIKQILVLLFILYQLVDLYGFINFLLSKHSKRFSPLHKATFQIYRRVFVSSRNKITFADDTLIYLVSFTLISVLFLFLILFSKFPSTFVLVELIILQLTILIIMIDSLFWIYYSATAPLTRLDAVMDAFSMFKEKQQTPKFKEKLQKIKERMAEYNPREILPKFLFRLLIIVAVFTLVYSIIYFSLTILDPGSFVDSNNSRVLTWEHILFYSVTNTTGVGSEISAQTFWARVFVQFHGITTLFIFVFMLTLVTSVALESIESQKNSLVQKISEIEENLSEDVEKDAK